MNIVFNKVGWRYGQPDLHFPHAQGGKRGLTPLLYVPKLRKAFACGLASPFLFRLRCFHDWRLIACIFGLGLAFGFASLDEEFSMFLNSSISSSSVKSRHRPAGYRQADVHDARAFQLRHFITEVFRTYGGSDDQALHRVMRERERRLSSPYTFCDGTEGWGTLVPMPRINSSVTGLFTVTIYSFSWSFPARRILFTRSPWLGEEISPASLYPDGQSGEDTAAVVNEINDVVLLAIFCGADNPNRFIQRDKHQSSASRGSMS